MMKNLYRLPYPNWDAGAITASSHRLRQSMEKMGSPACVNCILMSFSLIWICQSWMYLSRKSPSRISGQPVHRYQRIWRIPLCPAGTPFRCMRLSAQTHWRKCLKFRHRKGVTLHWSGPGVWAECRKNHKYFPGRSDFHHQGICGKQLLHQYQNFHVCR